MISKEFFKITGRLVKNISKNVSSAYASTGFILDLKATISPND